MAPLAPLATPMNGGPTAASAATCVLCNSTCKLIISTQT